MFKKENAPVDIGDVLLRWATLTQHHMAFIEILN